MKTWHEWWGAIGAEDKEAILLGFLLLALLARIIKSLCKLYRYGCRNHGGEGMFGRFRGLWCRLNVKFRVEYDGRDPHVVDGHDFTWKAYCPYCQESVREIPYQKEIPPTRWGAWKLSGTRRRLHV